MPGRAAIEQLDVGEGSREARQVGRCRFPRWIALRTVDDDEWRRERLAGRA